MSIQLSEMAAMFLNSLDRHKSVLSIDENIAAGMKWLSRAQDVSPDDGVSIRFSLIKGWGLSYPETTGYIIPTFFKYYEMTGKTSYKEKAMKMAEWELSIQQDDGSFIGGAYNKGIGKIVFDTGQVIFGLIGASKESKEERFLNAAIMAGDWLVKVQDPDGAWRRYTYNSIPHTYHSRVAWPLVKLYQATGDDRYLDGARRNINWVLSNQLPNGWFRNAGFTLENNNSPYTHTIAYTIRGILESGILLDEEEYISAAKKTVDALLKVMDPEGFFWGRYDTNWNRKKKFSCLTGNAQISIICLRLLEVTKDSRYINGAHVLNEYLKSKQNLSTNNENVRGAISGSYPIWGEYERFSYPNWATKFFIDALMLENEIERRNGEDGEMEKRGFD